MNKLAGYKISYTSLHEQGLEYTSISKAIAKIEEELIDVNKQLSANSMLDSVRSNLKTLTGQLEESQLTLKTAGEKLVAVTEKYLQSENKASQIIEDTGISKKDFYGSVDTLGQGENTAASATSASAGAAQGQTVVQQEASESNEIPVAMEQTSSSVESKIGIKDLDTSIFAAGLAGTVAAGVLGGGTSAIVGKRKEKVAETPQQTVQRDLIQGEVIDIEVE